MGKLGKEGIIMKSMGVFSGDENDWKLWLLYHSATIINHWTVHLKMVNYLICELYLNKVATKIGG